MLLLNFSHPLSDMLVQQAEALAGQKLEVKNLRAQFEADKPYAEQIVALVDIAALTSQLWQTQPILINPPSFNLITAALLAELHGRMGYFPPCLRLRPVNDSAPPLFEVAEIINLNGIREEARKRRA